LWHIKKSQFAKSPVDFMSIIAQSKYVLNRSFTDFVQMCVDVREWNLDFYQLERGRFTGEVHQFGTGSVHIAEAKFTRALLQRGVPPAGLRTIAIPATRQVRIKWRGCEVNGSDLMIFPRGAELDSVSDDRFHVYTCSFPEEVLSSICEQSGMAQMDILQNGDDVLRCSRKSISRIQCLLRNVALSSRSEVNEFDDSDREEMILHDLPRLVLHAIAEVGGATVPTITGSRDLVVKTAVRLIERFAGQRLAIRDLVDEVGVSQRTLEYAFRECLGVGPKTFLMSYRLNKVRRHLRSLPREDIRISDVANRWGFWHMGQFAADYRKFFEELPSETLKCRY
jgi:AraC family ethanolamine operon transcriptional activator